MPSYPHPTDIDDFAGGGETPLLQKFPRAERGDATPQAPSLRIPPRVALPSPPFEPLEDRAVMQALRISAPMKATGLVAQRRPLGLAPLMKPAVAGIVRKDIATGTPMEVVEAPVART